MTKRTKIVCTLGPASHTVETITEMVNAGMNVARLNFSHGSHEDHAALIATVREVEKKTGEHIAILQDLQGPKIRIGEMPEEGVAVEVGDKIVFDTSIDTYAGEAVPVDYKELHEFIKPGHRMMINDGKQEAEAITVDGTRISAEVVVGGSLLSHKGINVPDTTLTGRAMTDKDKSDAKFGIEQGVDMIALSFVQTPQDVTDLRELIDAHQKDSGISPNAPLQIIAKIERKEALDKITEISEVIDGIMVARGDLGIETPGAAVPVRQRELIDLALSQAKPVIVATQMMDSMQDNPRPTRAEVSDVGHAIMDHTDAVMLSNESAVGKYPVETVQMMHDIALEVEASTYDDLPVKQFDAPLAVSEDAIGQAAKMVADRVGAKAILVISPSGNTGRMVSRYRPELPIFVATDSTRVLHQLNLSWGVRPLLLKAIDDSQAAITESMSMITSHSDLGSGEQIIVVDIESSEAPPFLEIKQLP